jgi:cytoskeleton protein RodZ
MQKKEVTIPAGYGPGKTLHQARADLKLSHDDVALQLHLAARQILALENDDYENLPEPTYVRGYLRSYALLLGLTPEPILESYGQLLPAQKAPTVQKVSLGVDEEVSSKEPHIKFASYVVAALVVGLAIAWWQGYEPTGTAPSQSAVVPPAAEETLLAPAEPEDAGADKGALSEAMPKVNPAPPSPITTRVPASALPVAPPVSVEPVAPAPVAPASVPFSAPASNDDAAMRTGRAQIVLRTEQESWAEVRDGQDTRLLYESVPAGRTVKIEGEAPLNVFLGNVDGVRVEYNGQPYDTSRHKRGLVARFTLGASPPAPAPTDAPTP